MLVIRLQRTGRRNVPTYRLVVTEKTNPPKGKVKEYLGHFLPTRNPHVFEFKKERIEHWVKHGAQVSDTAARLLTNAGVDGLATFIKTYTKKKKRKEKKETEVKPAASDVKKDEEEKEVKEEKDKKEEKEEVKVKEVKEEAKKEKKAEEKPKEKVEDEEKKE